MVGKTKNRTKADAHRFALIQETGCVACRLDGRGYVPPDIHHLLSGGRRMSHRHTVGLCVWHHRGQKPEGMSVASVADMYGPSLAHSPRAFRERYGSEEELLRYQDAMIGWRDAA